MAIERKIGRAHAQPQTERSTGLTYYLKQYVPRESSMNEQEQGVIKLNCFLTLSNREVHQRKSNVETKTRPPVSSRGGEGRRNEARHRFHLQKPAKMAWLVHSRSKKVQGSSDASRWVLRKIKIRTSVYVLYFSYSLITIKMNFLIDAELAML